MYPQWLHCLCGAVAASLWGRVIESPPYWSTFKGRCADLWRCEMVDEKLSPAPVDDDEECCDLYGEYCHPCHEDDSPAEEQRDS